MELRQARYFLAVVEAGTITQAAQDLHIAQSAVSQQVARLERELGVALFDRSHRAVRLTRAGTDFVPAARALVEAEKAARRSVVDGREAGVVRIGISGGIDARLFRALQELRDAGTAVLTEAVTAPERIARVLDGRLDLAVLHGEHPHPGLESIVAARDTLSVVVNAGHPLAQHPHVHLRDLAAYPWVMQTDALGTPLAELVADRCRAAGFDPGPGLHSSSAPFALLASTAGAWTVFYAQQAQLLDGDALHLRFLDVVDTPHLEIALSVVTRAAGHGVAHRFARALGGAG